MIEQARKGQLVYRRKNRSTYDVDFVVAGLRVCEATPYKSKQEALAYARARRHLVVEDMMRRRLTGSMYRERITVEYAANKYLIAKRSTSASISYKEMTRNVGRLVRFFGAKTDLSSIDTLQVRELVSHRLAAGLKPISVRTAVVIPLRAMINFAIEELNADVPRRIKFGKLLPNFDQDRIRYMTIEEYERLFAILPEDEKLVHMAAILTGLRLHELLSLRWRECNFETERIHTKSKGGNKRIAFLPPRLIELLKTIDKPHEEFVFTFRPDHDVKQFSNLKGSPRRELKRNKRYPWSIDTFKHRCTKRFREANIVNYHFHDHRHTAACDAYARTKSILFVQKLLGHKCLKSTMKYTHLFDDDVMRNLVDAGGYYNRTK